MLHTCKTFRADMGASVRVPACWNVRGFSVKVKAMKEANTFQTVLNRFLFHEEHRTCCCPVPTISQSPLSLSTIPTPPPPFLSPPLFFISVQHHQLRQEWSKWSLECLQLPHLTIQRVPPITSEDITVPVHRTP